MVAHDAAHAADAIRLAATMLGGVAADQLPRFQAIIEQQVMHLTRLVGDLLDVSRVGVGKLRIECRPVNLLDVLDEAMVASRPAVDARLQHLSLRLPLQRLEVQADAMRLVQVFTNLLGNASKFTPEGGEVGLKVQGEGDSVVVTVSDTGIGISAEALSHIFDPFVQDARAVVVSGAGLGLGLTVVRELVHAHGGRVVARSPGIGGGSEFVVSLPLAHAAVPE
ncbi:HAMP domain-containing histidine kinase [Xanthomonas sp. Kuri4-3]